MTNSLMKRALERMVNPRPLPETAINYASTLRQEISLQRDEIQRLRARIAELERERDGLLELIV